MQPNTKYTCHFPVLFFIGITSTALIRFLVSKDFWSWLPLIIFSIPLISVWYILRPYDAYKKFKRNQFIENYKKGFDKLESIEDYLEVREAVNHDKSLSEVDRNQLLDHFELKIEFIERYKNPTEPVNGE